MGEGEVGVEGEGSVSVGLSSIHPVFSGGGMDEGEVHGKCVQGETEVQNGVFSIRASKCVRNHSCFNAILESFASGH